MQSARNLRGHHIWHSAASEFNRLNPRRWRKEKRMGTTLDNARFSCHWKATIHFSWKVLCRRWDFHGRLLFSTTSVQCSEVRVLLVLSIVLSTILISILFHRFHVDLRPYPIILRIDRELESHPAFRAAHPSNQPDCPPEAAK